VDELRAFVSTAEYAELAARRGRVAAHIGPFESFRGVLDKTDRPRSFSALFRDPGEEHHRRRPAPNHHDTRQGLCVTFGRPEERTPATRVPARFCTGSEQ
jgi:hypothetical protein